jgi:hypothetical protein
MPYQESSRLPGERASKIGHLEVIQSPLVRRLCEEFNDPKFDEGQVDVSLWQELPKEGEELRVIFAADGSLQEIIQPQPPYKSIAFVKTALLKLDQYAIGQIDQDAPNPFAIRDLLKDSALYHATAFPLKNVFIEGKSNYHAVREIIFESVKDQGLNNSLEGAVMDTLKWLAYEKWNVNPKERLEEFECPHCDEKVATLPFDQENGHCPNCNGEIFITDLFSLHLNMTEDFAPRQVASDYMSVSETLLIFTPIRYFWETNRDTLKRCLFIKDGPLSLRATLAKLAAPIRRFFAYAQSQGIQVAMIGQEKSGAFFDHLQLIGPASPAGSYFLPNNLYIREEIQHSNSTSTYGSDTNYGAKVFVKTNDYHQIVLTVPTGQRGEFVENPSPDRLIAFNNIMATLPKILSNKFEGALLPVELANKIASLSTYPSAKMLELFAEDLKGR